MRTFFLLLTIWLTAGHALGQAASAFPVIDLVRVNEQEEYFLGGQVAFWENQNEPIEPARVFAGEFESRFQNSRKDIPGPAYINGELWLRLAIRNPEAVPRSLILESRYALTDFISLYQKDPGGTITADDQGDRSLRRDDPYPFRSPAFSVMAYPGDNVYYLRTRSLGPNILSLYLWREAAFRGHRFIDTMILGGLFGFVLALFFYNSFLSLSLRSRTYSFYSIFLLNMVLLQASMQNVWPYLVRPEWASWLDNEGYIVIGSLTNFSAVLVTIYVLSMKKILPKYLRFFQFLLLFGLGPILIGPFAGLTNQARLVSVSVGLASGSMIVASITAILRGYRPAAYYLLASLTFLGANILLTFNLLGIYHDPHVIQYGNFLGVVVQGLLMSLAIGDGVQFIRSNADKVIRGLNQELQNHLAQVEAQVAERTETIRTILDNVASGFVIVSPAGKIRQGFSRSCHQLLSGKLHEGQAFVDLLKLAPQSRRIWDMAWVQIFQDLMPVTVSLAQLPSQIKIGKRSLMLEGKALHDERGRIKDLLFTIQDVTELRRKKREARRHRVLIKILQDMDAFRQFVMHSHDFIASLKVSTDKREQAFLLHTLKGNSLVFGLKGMARRLHELEELPKLSPNHILAIEQLFRGFLETHHDMLKTSWGPASIQETRITAAQLQRLKSVAAQHGDPKLHHEIGVWVDDVLARPVASLVQPLLESTRLLALRLNRRMRIEMHGADVRIRSQVEEKVLEFLVHILRNAIVHGMDEDREALGKAAEGCIELGFQGQADSLRISCRDDGRGFDRRHWEQKAVVVSGKAPAVLGRLSWVELVELVSRGGHSTQNHVSMEAGRGVGLEGIIHAVRELGGRIHMESEYHRGTYLEIEISRLKNHEAA